MSQFRWISKAVAGSWRATYEEALRDALIHGQAMAGLTEWDAITLRDFTTIQSRPCILTQE